LQGLATREATNPQFAFIKPTHSLFGFFTSLCDAYSHVTMPEKGERASAGGLPVQAAFRRLPSATA
jgi:splicing factor 3A subunit 1